MNELRELYQQMIIDHGKNPRHFHVDENATHIKDGFNPLCGDKFRFYLQAKNDVVESACFKGEGCAISIASASMLSEAVKDMSKGEIEKLFNDFHDLVTKGELDDAEEKLGKLSILGGVAEFPSRVKCATLAWHTVIAALNGDEKSVSTE